MAEALKYLKSLFFLSGFFVVSLISFPAEKHIQNLRSSLAILPHLRE